MRLQILSDLHLDCDADDGEAFACGLPVCGDALVLAGDVLPVGDVSLAVRAMGWFCRRFADVVYVPGNHEYFGSSPQEAAAALAACAAAWPNLHLLDAGCVTLGGVRLLGATLWYPRHDDDALYAPRMNDFRAIEGFVPWVHETHARHLAFLRAELRRGDVAITHHLPHPGSIAPRYANSPLNRYFLADAAAPLVEGRGAQLWVHGHTHVPCDYVVGQTRVLCNPRGYPGERAVPAYVGLTVSLSTTAATTPTA